MIGYTKITFFVCNLIVIVHIYIELFADRIYYPFVVYINGMLTRIDFMCFPFGTINGVWRIATTEARRTDIFGIIDFIGSFGKLYAYY